MATAAPAPGALQLGNVIATPNQGVTAAQTAAAQASGWKPAGAAPLAPAAPAASGQGTAPAAPGTPVAVPDGHTASSYVVPPYNAATGAGTLNGISGELGVSTTDLLGANPSVTNPNLLYPGQTLNVPSPSSPSSGYVPASPNPVSSAVPTSASVVPATGGTPAASPAPATGSSSPGAASAPVQAAPAGTTAATDPTSDGSPSYIQGSGAQRTIDQQTADQVAAATAFYGDQTGALAQAHTDAQDTIDNYIEQLQSRNDAEVANIGASFDVQSQQLQIQQKQQVGAASTALAKMGGYLGDSASGISYIDSLNNANQLAITGLNVARATAIQKANDAIADKNFAAAQAKVAEAKGYNDSVNALYTDTFNKIQDIQNNNLARQKTYLDNQTTMANQMAPSIVDQFNGDPVHDRTIAEQAAYNSGGQVSADALMSSARQYQLQKQQVEQAGTHYFPVNDPITGQPISVTRVNPDGTTESMSIGAAMQNGYTGTPSGATGVSAGAPAADSSSGTAPAAGTPAASPAPEVSANADGSETINGQRYTFRTLTSNNFKTSPSGSAYVDISGSPDKSIAMLEAKKTGLPIISDAGQSSDLIQAQKALQTVDNLQADFNQIAAPSNNVLSKLGTTVRNNLSTVTEPDRKTLINSYLTNKNGILSIIGTDAGGQPRTTGNLIDLTSAGIPVPGGNGTGAFSSDSITDGNVKFNKIRDQILSVFDNTLGTKTDPNAIYQASAQRVAALTAQKYPSSVSFNPIVPTTQAATTAPVAGFGWNP